MSAAPLLSAAAPSANAAVVAGAAVDVRVSVTNSSPRSYGAVAAAAGSDTAATVAAAIGAAADDTKANGPSAVDSGSAGSAERPTPNAPGVRRILLLAIGSRGDVQPMVALALALVAHNPQYVVDVGADKAYESFVREHKGVGFVPVNGNLEEWLATSSAGRALRAVKNPFTLIRMVKAAFSPLCTIWWTDIHNAMKARVYDLAVLSGISPAFATALFEAYPDTRLVWLFLFPAMHPTAQFLPATASRYQSPCGGCLNRVTWQSMAGMAAGIYDDIVNALRTERLGLNTDGTRPWWGTFQLIDKWRLPIIDAYSTVLVPQPPEWPDHHRVTGALFLDAAQPAAAAAPAPAPAAAAAAAVTDDAKAGSAAAAAAVAPTTTMTGGAGGAATRAAYSPHPLLAEFLDASQHGGEQAVYLGLGSMMSCFMERDRTEAVGRILAAAARRVGRRALIVTAGWTAEAARVFGVADLTQAVAPGTRTADAWALLNAPYNDGSVLPIGGVPHDYAFPRVAAVVTHGGAGTTHAALRAGRPTVFVPFGADQPWWGQLCVSRGLASACIAHTDVTADNLAAALRVAVDDQRMRSACARVADAMACENGCAKAVAIIERELNTTPAGPFSDKRVNEWATFQHHINTGPPKSYAKLYAAVFVVGLLLLIIGAATHWFGTQSKA